MRCEAARPPMAPKIAQGIGLKIGPGIGLSGRIAMAAAAALFVALPVAGCHSYHIDINLENRTGAAIKLLEVDYPDASYGADAVASGADFHYRIQVEGSGQMKITYTAADNKVAHIAGPELEQRQQGRMEIVLLPGGKAEFHPELTGP